MSALQNSNKKTKLNSKAYEKIILMISCFIIQTTMLFVASFSALAADVKSKSYYALCIIALCIGCFVSGFISVRKIKKNGLLNGILFCLPSNILFIVISAALNAFQVDFFTILNFALLLFSSSAGGVVSVNFKQKSKIKSKR